MRIKVDFDQDRGEATVMIDGQLWPVLHDASIEIERPVMVDVAAEARARDGFARFKHTGERVLRIRGAEAVR